MVGFVELIFNKVGGGFQRVFDSWMQFTSTDRCCLKGGYLATADIPKKKLIFAKGES